MTRKGRRLRPRLRAHSDHPSHSYARTGDSRHVNTAAEIVLALLVLVPFGLVVGLFIWAAFKDGEEDRALQARLGIRRKTRLGR